MLKKIVIILNTWILRLKGANLGYKTRIHNGLELNKCKNISIGKFSTLYKNITVYLYQNGNFRIGSNTHIAPYGYFLIGNKLVKIGDDVAIGPFCSFFCQSNDYSKDEPIFRKNYKYGEIIIGNNVFIGAHCVILPGTEISDNVILAANSTASGFLESGFIYGGNPAKKIKSI